MEGKERLVAYQDNDGSIRSSLLLEKRKEDVNVGPVGTF